MISLARRGRAGERDLLDARVPDEVRADRRPGAGDDVDRRPAGSRPRRRARPSAAPKRRRGVGLEHDRAAGRERGCELPGRHHQREVPGHDLAEDAHGLLQRIEEERPADRVRAARDRPRSPKRRKRKFSIAWASSALTDEIALPTLRASSSASSLRFATSASASAWRRRERSFGGVLPQSPFSAPRRPSTARSTSCLVRHRRRSPARRRSRARRGHASRRKPPRRTRRR